MAILLTLLLLLTFVSNSSSARAYHIIIDGDFTDWNQIPSYSDPDDAEDGSVYDNNVPDCHDTDHETIDSPPNHVYNEHVNILEYKFTHDQESLYIYIRAKASIGKTASEGRYYVICTIDVDQNDSTGYWLHEGGYWPTTPGYDVNAEMEFYDGHWNHGYYINHGCNDTESYNSAKLANINGVTVIQQGFYNFYTEYDYWSPGSIPSADEQTRCQDGMFILPSGNEYICFSTDAAPGPFSTAALSFSLSANQTELEFRVPFIGFMKDASGQPIIALGKTLDISLSLETSGEYSTPVGEWASDTAAPIQDYLLEGF